MAMARAKKSGMDHRAPSPMPISRNVARFQDRSQMCRSAKVQGVRTPIQQLGPFRQKCMSPPIPKHIPARICRTLGGSWVKECP